MIRAAGFCFTLALMVVGPAAGGLRAQQGPAAGASTIGVAPSGRATTKVNLTRPRVEGAPRPEPIAVSIDYGQPHARGREIAGNLVPDSTVWRTGANSATELTTDVDIRIGDALVPKGKYTLFTLYAPEGSQLFINRQTAQWGTEYHAEQDLARVDLRTRTLAEPVESFTIWLIPSTEGPAHGELRMAWGDLEFTTDWRVVQ
ncbi:MAG: DUF2911 domain-containing protein [Gemmatimonadaceae bacterium]